MVNYLEMLIMKKSFQSIKIFFLVSMLILIFSIKASQSIESIFIPHSDFISQVEWSPDGTKLAFISGFEIHILDTENWETIAVIMQGSSYITWHPDSQLLAGSLGGNSERIFIWDANNGKLIREFGRLDHSRFDRSLTPQPQTIAWHPDGDIIATDASLPYVPRRPYPYPEEILLWDVNSSTVIQRPRLIEVTTATWHNSVNLEWSHNGEMLLSTGADDLPINPRNYMTEPVSYVLDVENNEVLFTLVGAISWSSDDNMIAGFNSHRRLTIWDVTSQDIINFGQTNISPFSLEWHSYLPVIASLDMKSNLHIWNVDTDITYETSMVNLSSARDLSWKPNSHTLAISGSDGIIIQTYDLD